MARQEKRRSKHFRPNIESLESRELMASGITPELLDNVLEIRGTSGNDTIRVSESGSYLEVNNGQRFLSSKVSQIRVLGYEGSDTIDLHATRKAATIDGGDGEDDIDRIIAIRPGNITLTNSSLTTNDSRFANVSLSNIEDAWISGTASSNDFNVIGWTGSATLAGGSGFDKIIANRPGNITLTDAQLSTTDTRYGAIAMHQIEDARIVGSAGANDFHVSGWTGSAWLDGNAGYDRLIANRPGNITLTDSRFSTTDGRHNAITLRKFEDARITGSADDNDFDVIGWTKTATLNGGAGFDRIIANRPGNITLTDSRFSTSDARYGAIILREFDNARITGSAGANDFDVSGWTGSAWLDGSAGYDRIIANRPGNITLTDSRLSTSDTRYDAITLREFDDARLTGSADDNDFDVSGWTKTATLNGGPGNDRIIAIRPGNITLTDSRLSTSDTRYGAIQLHEIDDARITGSASANDFDVSGWTGSASLDGGEGYDRIIANRPGNITLTDSRLSTSDTRYDAITLQGFDDTRITGSADANDFDVTNWTRKATLYGQGGSDRLIVIRPGTITHTHNSSATTDPRFEVIMFHEFENIIDLDTFSHMDPTDAARFIRSLSWATLTAIYNQLDPAVAVPIIRTNEWTMVKEIYKRMDPVVAAHPIHTHPYQVNRTIYIVGSNQGDTTRIDPDSSGQLRVGHQGRVFFFDRSSVDQINWFGLGGHDNLVNHTNVRLDADGGFGNDTLQGGDGRDTLYGGHDNDELWGGLNDDLLDGGNNKDTLHGEAGNDTLYGGDSNDQLFGGNDNDTLYGGPGSDRLNGGNDADALWGGLHQDRLEGGDGNDTLYGEAGFDTLFGGSGSDTLDGGHDNDVLHGGLHQDLLYGGNDKDTLYGDAGNDTLYGGDSNDELHGGNDNDTLYGESGSDTLKGGNDADELWGGLHQDRLEGGDGNDTLYGGFGHDTLYGESGSDTLDGGHDNDVLHGGLHQDLLYGGNDKDTLYGDAGNDTLYGGDSNDQLFGGDNNDTLYGGSGSDTLKGGNHADELWGGLHQDQLEGGDGNDELYGQDGFDTLSGGSGNDTLDGGNSNDKLYGGTDQDLLDGGSGHDLLSGNDGLDTLLGDTGNDTLYGGNHDDKLYGGTDQDLLDGGSGHDDIWGGSGHDTLTGGEGQDQLSGGSNDDVIVFNSTASVDLEHGVAIDGDKIERFVGIENVNGESVNHFDPRLAALTDFTDSIRNLFDSLSDDDIDAIRSSFLSEASGSAFNLFSTEQFWEEYDKAKEDSGAKDTWDNVTGAPEQGVAILRNLATTAIQTVTDLGSDAARILAEFEASLSNITTPADFGKAVWVFVRDAVMLMPTHGVDLFIDIMSDTFMGVWFSRPMTDGEKDFAHSIFGDKIDVSSVRITNFAISSAGMAGGNVIYIGHGETLKDVDPLEHKPLFAHELTHVYQDQNGRHMAGTVEATREFFTSSRDVYAVDADDNLDWDQLRPEQQATVVGHYQHYLDWVAKYSSQGVVLGTDPDSGSLPAGVNNIAWQVNFEGENRLDYLEGVLKEASLFQWKYRVTILCPDI